MALTDAFDKLIQEWLPHNEELRPFYDGIDEFLTDYLPMSKTEENDHFEAKIIADPLLGYIHLTALEVAIMDTQLFQRLRKISQLGLANLVFPSLGYSRFEHSLGVLGRLNQVLNKLIENNLRSNENSTLKQDIDEHLISIRLAALLHDSGHCLFSHCSERVIEKVRGEYKYPSGERIQKIYTEHFKKEKNIAFAEIFSITLIGSKKFQHFIEHIGFHNQKTVKKILEATGRFIIGLPIADKPSTIFLSQLMSSGLDVDKIDYMIREQHYSGIKLEIDLDRILSKLRVFDLKSFELPKQLEHHKKFYKADSTFKVLGFEKGGQFAFEEFCVARLALHVKIYLHQKVRSAEGQLSTYLEKLAEHDTLKLAHNWLRLSEYIIENPQSILTQFPSAGTLFQIVIPDELSNLFKKINERHLFYRAFSFGPMNSYSEGIQDDNLVLKNQHLEKFFEHYNINDLKKKIIDECTQICDEYDIKVDLGLFREMFIEIPRLINIQQGQESLHFERASWLPLKWTIPIDKILIYFQENRALAYIFSPSEIAHVISVAAEKVIFEQTTKVFSQEGNISRRTFDRYKRLKADLTDRTPYYNRLPQLKPVSDYLNGAEASESIQLIQEKLAGFKSLNDDYITINRITTFLNQFPMDLQEAGLSFLKQLHLYNENLLKDELEKLLTKINNSDKKIGITYLGSVADSGARLAYYLRPVFEHFNLEAGEFNDDLILENDKIIFYDDNINSGLQLVNIFAELLSEKEKLPLEWQLNESHHRKLRVEEAKAKFKCMPIYITYIVGYEKAIEKVKEVLVDILGFKSENITIQIHITFKENEKIFSGADSHFNHAQKKELRDYLNQIGEKLLEAENKDSQKIENCRLGYSNAEAMVLFPYNIPTMTITALWLKGTVGGIPWIPLAERRRRTSKDGKHIGEE